MREVKELPGPGHDGNGGVVMPTFYGQSKQHQPPNPQGHPSLGPPRPPPPVMRGSPVPSGAIPNNPSGHMAQVVGAPSNVMLGHPGGNQAEGNPRMHAPGYPPTNPHMPGTPGGAPHGYPSKMPHMGSGPPGPGYGQPGFQHAPSHQYPGSRPPTHMMQPYSQGYPPGTAPGSQGPPSTMPPGHQYPPRPPNQAYAYQHFSQASWSGQGPPNSGMPGGPSMMGATPGMPGKPPGHMANQQSQPGPNNIVGRRAHTPPLFMKAQMQHKMGAYPPPGHQMYPNGPGMPPMMNNRENIQNSMPPPPSASQLQMDGENHSSNTVNSLSNNLPNNVNSSNPPQIGPDGNPVLDEGSQTSTVSNNSAASGDDRSTPKPHKDQMMMAAQHMLGPMVIPGAPHMTQHPPTPKNCAASPGTLSMTSQPEENDSLSSPCWPRSPAAPSTFVNSQPPPPPPEVYRTTKAGDSLLRLYEMSDSPERKAWLDKLLRFMEDNKTPITTCPTISKNPLDLYALYLHVREKGGFEEITKNKQWKDVAAVMGIGASSSGSYTLRKHYMKHILSYECKFDRGGIDPQPIINQIESSQKKKSTKSISVPSPVGSNNNSMDGFTNGPHMPAGPGMGGSYSQYPPSSEYPGHMQQRPSNQPGFQGMPGGQYSGYQVMHGPYGSGAYPNTGFNPERAYPGPTGPTPGGYGYQQPPGYQRTAYPPTQQPYPSDQYGTMPNSSPASGYGNSQLARQLLNPARNPVPINQPYQNNTMYPNKPGPSPSPGPQVPPAAPGSYPQPRRHPDFDKAQTWRPPNSQFPPGYGGPQSQGPPMPQQQWPRSIEASPQSTPPQWNQPRFPQPQSFPNQQQWNNSPYSGAPRKPTPAPGQKVFQLNQTSFKSTGYGAYMGKQLFPMDSVEAVSPVLIKRRRMGKSDLKAFDPWRIVMSLRSGMVAEVTWALDCLNILLYDDRTVFYFGLVDMPGILDVLVEHFRRGLINMFNICTDLELGRDDEATGANKRVKAELCDSYDHPWYVARSSSPELELDLGISEDNYLPEDKDVLLSGGEDFTLKTRTGKIVKIAKREPQLFMKEGIRDWDKWEGFDSGIDTWAVGGGECTAHFHCNMQSSVPPLPFTKLLTDVESSSTEVIFESHEVVEVTVEGKSSSLISPSEENIDNRETSMLSVSEEIVDAKVSSLSASSEETAEENISSPIDPTKSIEKEMTVQEEVSAPLKPNDLKALKPSISKSIFGKNKKGLKSLDAILKRIQKEPVDSPKILEENVKSIVDKDTKSILDHYLITSDQQKNNSVSELQKDTLQVPEADLKPTVKSPSKLPSLSPIKISDRPDSSRSSMGSRRESAGFKRPYEDLEEESWCPDEASLSTTTEGQDWLAKRVIAVGTVIRNLTFVPGNEDVMSKSAPLLALLGKTTLLHHTHPSRESNSPHYEKEEEFEFSDWCSSLAPDTYWWWPYLSHVQENTLVTIANIAGYLDLSYYPEEISRPILNGLLHWATCPASYGQDPLPSSCALSAQRLSLEALVKLCVLDSNTDLVLATPPFSRLDMLCSQLTRLLCRGEDQVLREFAINLFHYFSAADSGVARVIAMQNGCVSLLTAFIEEAEANAMSVANAQGVPALKENPELMGTSLDMVRRAANTLVNLSRVPDNQRVLSTCEARILGLVMSQILDTYVASQLSQVLFNIAQTNEVSLRQSTISPSAEDRSSKDLVPLVSKEFDSQTMECLRNIENKNKAIHVITESEPEPQPKKEKEHAKDDQNPSIVESVEQESKSTVAGNPAPIEVSLQSSDPSSPVLMASHPSVSSSLLQSNFAETSTASRHTLKCSTSPSGVETKVTSQATPSL